MEITLTIKKLDVFNEVGRTTAYYGTADGEGAPGYDTASATPDDHEMLEVYWRGAKNDILRLSLRFAPLEISAAPNNQTTDQNEDFTLKLTMPSTWDTDTTEPLRNAMRLYLIHDITAKWAMRAIPSAYENIAALSKEDSLSITHLLHHTLRPAYEPNNQHQCPCQ